METPGDTPTGYTDSSPASDGLSEYLTFEDYTQFFPRLKDRREAARLEDRGPKQMYTGMARHKPTTRSRREHIDLVIV